MAGHEIVEKNSFVLLIMTIIVISVAGMVQIVPLFFIDETTTPVEGLKPYTPLQLTGRDIYIRESCNACHSQMIRPFRAETERYGHYSVAGEFVYDHPFLWGSKRTGPDLARVGGRYSDKWHKMHLTDPRSVVPESNMPSFPWLGKNAADHEGVQAKMKVMQKLGVPYSDEDIAVAPDGVKDKTELDALIAYLQNMGTNIKTVR